jgi:hypothetical protein
MKTPHLTYIVLVFFFLGICNRVNADHIIGGELMYQFIEKKGQVHYYKVILHLYVDCRYGKPSAVDDDKNRPIFIHKKIIYPNKSVDYIFQQKISISNALKSVERGSEWRGCIKMLGFCVDKYIYETNLSVLDSNNMGSGFVISYETCCRGWQTNNIINPSSTGSTLFRIPKQFQSIAARPLTFCQLTLHVSIRQ